jgi:hypothetical protein
MLKRIIRICVVVAATVGLYRLLGWWALAISVAALLAWTGSKKVRRQRITNADHASMTAETFLQQLEEQVSRAAELVNSGNYREAQVIYEKVAELLLTLRESQRQEVPGQTVSLSHRLMFADRLLAVPLRRLADLHLLLGNRAVASRYFLQVVDVMQEAALHAGGETKVEFEAMMADAQRSAKEIEGPLVPLLSQPTNLEAFEARYLHLIAQIMRLPGVASEATLLLARRVLQRRSNRIAEDDIRSAILDIGQLPEYGALTEDELKGFASNHRADVWSLANDLANLYRDHIRLV